MAEKNGMKYLPVLLFILTAAVSFGGGVYALGTKVDTVKAIEIAEKVVRENAYSRTEGEILKNNLRHIKETLDEIKQMLKERR